MIRLAKGNLLVYSDFNEFYLNSKVAGMTLYSINIGLIFFFVCEFEFLFAYELSPPRSFPLLLFLFFSYSNFFIKL